MRPFSFQRKGAIIRTLKEPVIKKKKFNLDRVLYLALILLVLGFLLRYVYKKLAIIEGDGQIQMEKVDVNFTQDIRLLGIKITEGDTVSRDQLLFYYKESVFDNDASAILRERKAKEDRLQDVQKLVFEIQQKELKLKAQVQKRNYLRNTKDRFEKFVLLDVYTKEKLDEVIQQLNEAEITTELLRNEIQLLSKLKKMNFSDTSSDTQREGKNNYRNNYLSPINGVIGQILKNEQEACYKTENVMTIHNTDVVFIKAYFDLKDINDIKQGQEVKVLFPDQSTTKGRIQKIYIATYESPDEFQKTYEPTERNILAEIIPINDMEKTQWASYHKLNVKIQLGKI